MISNNLKVVAVFSFPHEAHIAKASLEAANIDAFIANEHTINMQWLYSNALGGIQLLVHHELADEAKEILSTDFSENLDKEISTEKTSCPKCGSLKVIPYTKGKKPAFLVFLLLGFPLFFYKHGFKCQDCGKFFKLALTNS